MSDFYYSQTARRSGKTEYFFRLALEKLRAGENVLFVAATEAEAFRLHHKIKEAGFNPIGRVRVI